MDWENNALVYSQEFPEKSLDGHYKFDAKILGQPMTTKGNWSLVLYNYSQTTTVTRLGGPGERLKVRVEIDKIGDMKLHISDLLGGRMVMESIADFLINTAWQPSFPFIKPLINDLVSTAFTDIFNESFRYFPIDKIIKWSLWNQLKATYQFKVFVNWKDFIWIKWLILIKYFSLSR